MLSRLQHIHYYTLNSTDTTDIRVLSDGVRARAQAQAKANLQGRKTAAPRQRGLSALPPNTALQGRADRRETPTPNVAF